MTLRYGLIGCGEIGKLRAEGLRRSGRSLTAVSDLDTARASQIAAGAPVEANWRDLIKRPDVDAVIVSTPPSLHAEMTIAALRAGKHVLCEKPLARTLEECREMVKVAGETGRFLATGFNYRFYPSVLKARELVDSGIIGKVDHIRSYTGYSATAHNHPWLHDTKVMGGGTLRDNGIHLLDLTCYFLGDVAEAQGATSELVWGFPGCEDNGCVLLRNRRGAVASAQSTWNEWRGYRFQIGITGERGTIDLSCFPMITRAAWAPERGGKLQRKSWYFPMVHLMEHLKSYRWVVVESFLHEFEQFEKAVRGEASAVATGQDGLLTVQVALAAAPAAKSRPTGGDAAPLEKVEPEPQQSLPLSAVVITVESAARLRSCLGALRQQVAAPAMETLVPWDGSHGDCAAARAGLSRSEVCSHGKPEAHLRAIARYRHRPIDGAHRRHHGRPLHAGAGLVQADSGNPPRAACRHRGCGGEANPGRGDELGLLPGRLPTLSGSGGRAVAAPYRRQCDLQTRRARRHSRVVEDGVSRKCNSRCARGARPIAVAFAEDCSTPEKANLAGGGDARPLFFRTPVRQYARGGDERDAAAEADGVVRAASRSAADARDLACGAHAAVYRRLAAGLPGTRADLDGVVLGRIRRLRDGAARP